MNIKESIEALEIEAYCAYLESKGRCSKDCAECRYALPASVRYEALETAIRALKTAKI